MAACGQRRAIIAWPGNEWRLLGWRPALGKGDADSDSERRDDGGQHDPPAPSLALAVLATTVGLIRSEAVRDLRTLTATGAPSSTRRSIAAATAGALGMLGAFCGVAVAYIVSVAYFRSQLEERLGQFPVVDIVLILFALPLAASFGGWLLAGREPPDMGRQPIE